MFCQLDSVGLSLIMKLALGRLTQKIPTDFIKCELTMAATGNNWMQGREAASQMLKVSREINRKGLKTYGEKLAWH